MAVTEKETVVVEDRDRNSGSWIIILVIIALLFLAFFYFGGFSMFNGGNSTETINVNTPDEVQVQPSN
jgi:hypothetical protein